MAVITLLLFRPDGIFVSDPILMSGANLSLVTSLLPIMLATTPEGLIERDLFADRFPPPCSPELAPVLICRFVVVEMFVSAVLNLLSWLEISTSAVLSLFPWLVMFVSVVTILPA